MVPIEDNILDTFFSAIFGGEEVSADLKEILGHSMKCVGLGIPYLSCWQSVFKYERRETFLRKVYRSSVWALRINQYLVDFNL